MVIVSFYLPGSVVTAKLRLKSSSLYILFSFVIGMVLLAYQGYAFGYLHARWLTYFYFGVAVLLWYRDKSFHQNYLKAALEKIYKQDRKVIFCLLSGAVFQSLIMFGSGLRFPNGVEFFRTNTVDGVMHLSYIQSIARQFPPVEPGASGLMLTNYHYWSDLVMAEMVRVWLISPSIIFFQVLPIIISLLTGVATYLLIKAWGGSQKTAYWGVFFLYLAGDAAYVFMLFFQHHFGFYTPEIDNGITQFLNMPHAFAKLVFLTSLLPFTFWTKTKKTSWGLLSIFLFASLTGFKIYYGIFVGVGLVTCTAVQFVQAILKRQSIWQLRTQMMLCFLFVMIAASIFLPANHGSGGLFFSPLEWPKIFLGKDYMNWNGWWLRLQVYETTRNYKYITLLDAAAIFICLVSVYGTRLIGVWPVKSLREKLGTELLAFLIVPSVLFVVLGLTTLQVSGAFNVFNFFVVSSIIFSIFAAFSLSQLQTSHSYLTKFVLIALIILTIPRVTNDFFEIIKMYQNNHSDYTVSADELAAFQYMRSKLPPEAIIQAHPSNYLDHQTPYVPYFADHNAYLSGVNMLVTHNQPIDDRSKELVQLFKTENPGTFAAELKARHIEYVYLQKKADERLFFQVPNEHFPVLFENNSTMVLGVK